MALRNLYNLRGQTAGTIGMLSGAAGGADRAQAQQAFHMGTQQASQRDIALQRQLQILLQLLSAGQQVGFQYQQGGGGLGGMLASALGGAGGGLGGILGNVLSEAGQAVDGWPIR